MTNSKSLTTTISSSIASLNKQISPQTQQATTALIQASIASVGQLVPIVMNGAVVIDGHKRMVACKNLGIQPKTVQVSQLGNGNQSSPLNLAIWTSLNVARGHLSQNELALIAAELYQLRPTAPNGQKLSQEAICQNLGISPDTVGRVVTAQHLAKQQGAEDTVKERLQRGDSPRQILRDLEGERIARYNLKTYCQSNLKVAQDLHAMAASNQQFSFIYADPPWAEAIARTPYPTIPTGQNGDTPNQDGTYPTVCSMAADIKKLAAKDAVLWLWTTSSLLQNGLRVMEAWGFKYATMIVWAKSRTNQSKGAVLPKHELILVGKMRQEDEESLGEDQDIVLVAKRGSGLGTPENPIPSVIELPAPDKVVHSQKPEKFAELARRLYPTQAKLELFARQSRDGWATWGNQSDGKALKQLAAAKPRSGGHQNNKSATAGMAKHRGRRQVVQKTIVVESRAAYETSEEFNRTKNILLD